MSWHHVRHLKESTQFLCEAANVCLDDKSSSVLFLGRRRTESTEQIAENCGLFVLLALHPFTCLIFTKLSWETSQPRHFRPLWNLGQDKFDLDTRETHNDTFLSHSLTPFYVVPNVNNWRVQATLTNSRWIRGGKSKTFPHSIQKKKPQTTYTHPTTFFLISPHKTQNTKHKTKTKKQPHQYAATDGTTAMANTSGANDSYMIQPQRMDSVGNLDHEGASFFSMLKLLLWKNYMQQCRRRMKGWCCKMLFPVFLMGVAW